MIYDMTSNKPNDLLQAGCFGEFCVRSGGGMDKRTRVLSAMDKKEVDHVPVGFWFHFAGGEASGEACVQAHLKYYRDVDADFIKVMCDGYFPYPITTKIEKAADWRGLKPLGKDHPFIQEQVWRARRIKEEVKDECCVFYNVFAPFSSIRFGAGDELVMRHIREDPEAVIHALDVIARDNALLAELMIREAKNDGIYYCVQGAELDRFSYQEYRGMITPSDLYVLNHANEISDTNIIHMCGWAGLKNRIENWKDYPARVVNWAVHVEDMSLEEGREYFGGKTVLGGFQNTRPGVLFYGTEEKARRFTRELIHGFGKKGLIIGADCTIPNEVDYHRFKWVVEESRTI
jgi:uroporphyrinogen decarboxylase